MKNLKSFGIALVAAIAIIASVVCSNEACAYYGSPVSHGYSRHIGYRHYGRHYSYRHFGHHYGRHYSYRHFGHHYGRRGYRRFGHRRFYR